MKSPFRTSSGRETKVNISPLPRVFDTLIQLGIGTHCVKSSSLMAWIKIKYKKAAHLSRFFLSCANGMLSHLTFEFFVERIDDNGMRLIDFVVRKWMTFFGIMRQWVAISE